MRIFRISNLLSLAVATTLGVLLFWTSQAVQQKEDQLSNLQKNLTQEEEGIRVLSVEWDYLNRPQRLEKMAIEQLGMEPPSASEVVQKIEDIPEPFVVPFDAQSAMPVSLETEPQKKEIPLKSEVVAPEKADKQSFERLINSLENESAGGQ